MIVSVFGRRLKPGATFQDFVREWEAGEGFGVPARVFNAQSLTDPREIISIGFVDVGTRQLKQWLSTASAPEAARHERIDSVIESTTLRSMCEPPHRTRLLAPAPADRHRIPREPARRADRWRLPPIKGPLVPTRRT